MKILCGYSSVEFNCDNIPGYYHARETVHPVFHIPQKKLLAMMGKWSSGGLTPTDSYLIFLAMLNSTGLANFRVPAIRGKHTDQIVAQHIEILANTIILINSVSTPAVKFPIVVITPETRELDNAYFWIQTWRDTYADFKSGYRSTVDSQRIIRREAALERLIKNPFRTETTLAHALADWAADAADFPSFKTKVNETEVICSEYWKEVIRKLSLNVDIYSIREQDVNEILEHCEEHIALGSIFSHELFKVLREGKERIKNFYNLGDYDAANLKFTPFGILPDDATPAQAAIQNIVDLAPQEEPKLEQYPNKAAYIQARARWNIANRHKKED